MNFKRLVLGLAFLLGAIGLTVGGGSLWLHHQVSTPYQGYPDEEVLVDIPRGHSVPRIAELLEKEGVISSARLLVLYTRLVSRNVPLQAGEYRFSGPLSLKDVVSMLREGRIYHHRLTLPEGLAQMDVAPLLAAKGFGEVESFLEAFRRTDWIEDLDPEAEDLEGYLFPETYFVTRSMSEEEIVRGLVRGFRRVWTPERMLRAQELGMTVREVVTLASLIEKETSMPPERTLVSAVFHNRLKRNMTLGCDPTVIYAVRRVQEFDGVIRRSHLQIDSPYNTYLYPGLPPGPIANPGEASIDAALNPASVDYLFFVSRNDGSHYFSTNYADHRRAVRRYQR